MSKACTAISQTDLNTVETAINTATTTIRRVSATVDEPLNGYALEDGDAFETIEIIVY